MIGVDAGDLRTQLAGEVLALLALAVDGGFPPRRTPYPQVDDGLLLRSLFDI
nr:MULTISPECIES: hypothetical protein [Pseudofrankia]